MKKKLLLGVSLVLWLSCSDKNRIPPGVLPPEKMQQILLDIYTADAYARHMQGKDSSLDITKESVKLYTEVLNIHSTTGKDFYRSYQFYLGRPDMLKIIMDSVSNMSERRRNAFYQSGKPE